MRDYERELKERTEFIKSVLLQANAEGIVFGNSGGKDSALVGILCKAATDNVLGIMLPCGSKQNYGSDIDDAKLLAERFGIDNITVDLTAAREEVIKATENSAELSKLSKLSELSITNIAPRLRMITLYSIAQTKNYLVAGTGNRSERYLGYFTKWGDGACDFNPISDLTVSEVYDFLKFLKAPDSIIGKAPSAGLFEGQTDEQDMGLRYADVDEFLLNGTGDPETIAKINSMNKKTRHKLNSIAVFKNIDNSGQ